VSDDRTLVLQTANAFANAWAGIVALSETLNAGGHVLEIAKQTGWSVTSIQKRMNACAFFRNRGVDFDSLVEWGPEKTVSEWQKQCNQANVKGPGDIKKLIFTVDVGLHDKFHEALKRIMSVTGCSKEDAIQFMADREDLLDDQTLLHDYKQVMGG
jgi:hypothetical protein